jgi:hypothetical protein
MKYVKVAVRAFRYFWAMPCSLVGLMVALVAILFGATARIDEGALEVSGGRLGEWSSRLPFSYQLYAITLGHVILGINHASLSSSRSHEQVHVSQYERWGILFIPLYCGSSILQLLRGRDPYLENRFEREARSK